MFRVFFGSFAAYFFCAAAVCGQPQDFTAAGDDGDALPQTATVSTAPQTTATTTATARAAGHPQASTGSWSEVSFHIGEGLSTLLYGLSQGSRSPGTGGDAGIGYVIFPVRRFGVGTGAGIALFSASSTLKDLQGVVPNLVSEDGDLYDMHTAYLRHTEKQRAAFVRIPLTLHYRTFGRLPLYVQAGASVFLPLSARYEVSDAAIANSGYFHKYNNWATYPSYLGFGDFSVPSASGSLSLKPVFTASAEAGLRWQLKKLPWAVYTNLYIDCGLNSARDDAQPEKLLWNAETSPSDFEVGSMLSSRYDPDHSFSGRITLLSAGVRVRIAFGWQPKLAGSR